MPKRIVFLNALPLNAFLKDRCVIKLWITKAEPKYVKTLIESRKGEAEIQSYIRHPSTVKALSELLGIKLQPSSSIYTYTEGDTVIVVSLKKPARGQEVEVTIEDLDFYLVEVK